MMKTLLVILFGVFLFPIMGGIVEDSTVLTKNGSTDTPLSSTNGTCLFPSAQLQALESLYNSTNGKHWKWRETLQTTNGNVWNFTVENPNPCADVWIGINCSTTKPYQPCNVTKLILVDFRLKGVLPPTLQELDTLEEMDLGSNYLTGSIPETLTQLQHLSVLFLRENFLSDGLPASIGQMPGLKILDVADNSLVALFPPEFNGLTNLEYLNASTNYITGEILPTFENLTSLKILDLSYNDITGSIPSCSGKLSRLVSFEMKRNNLIGNIPDDLGQWRFMHVFDVSNNTLTGTLPTSLSNWSSLVQFSIRNNELRGQLSNELIENWVRLRELNVVNNSFSGPIPAAIGKLAQLVQCVMNDNKFTGSFPNQVTQLSHLQTCILSRNKLNGTIPIEIGRFKMLKVLELYDNMFLGTIPPAIGNLTDLAALDLGYNQFNGSIPYELCQLKKLEYFLYNQNYFTGSFPDCLGDMEALVDIYGNDNFMTGSLPDNIVNLRNLSFFFISANKFTGSLPHGFGANFLTLFEIDVHDNLFSGTLPSSLCNMAVLLEMYLSQNGFFGEIPHCIGKVKNLTQLYLQYNSFDSTIPQSFSNFSNMRILILDSNQFTGVVPEDFFLSSGESIFVYIAANNYFTGTIPSFLGPFNSSKLYAFNISNNSYTGTIPFEISNLTQLVTLDLSNNQFTSSIPTDGLSSLSLLRTLFLQNNFFSGPLHVVLNATRQKYLADIDVSGNYFSGTLPDEWFSVKGGLITFAAVKNCITGSIPSSICEGPNTTSLALDGLNTAERCQNRNFPRFLTKFITTYRLKKGLEGTIPVCLYNMPSLKTLHLSGNGIDSTIPSSVVLGKNLSHLSLSHNLIKGTIPQSIQQHTFTNLDLSFNRIGGVLSNQFAAYSLQNASLALQVNRLSGNIPKILLNLQNISILQGNLFRCIDGDNSLPEYDEYKRAYVCGSDSVNYALIAWFVGICVTVLVIVLYYYLFISWTTQKIQMLLNYLNPWRTVFKDKNFLYQQVNASNRMTLTERATLSKSMRLSMFITTSGKNMTTKSKTDDGKVNYIYRFGLLLNRLRKVVGNVTVMLIFLMMPAYIILTHFYAMYFQSYAWIAGMVFLSGVTPAIILLALFIGFYAVMDRLLQVWLFDKYREDAVFQPFHSLQKTANQALMLPWTMMKMLQTENEDTQENNTEVANDNETIEEDNAEGIHGTANGVFKSALLRKNKIQHDIAASRWLFRFKVFLIFLINVVIVLFVNMLYVYSTTKNIPRVLLMSIAFLTSGFKIIWGNTILMGVFRKILLRRYEIALHSSYDSTNVIVSSRTQTITPRETISKKNTTELWMSFNTDQEVLEHYTSAALRFLVYLSIFNNVIAPSIAAMAISPNCIYYLLVSSPDVKVSYQFLQCADFTTGAIKNSCTGVVLKTHSASYSPPFAYNYQCSSSLITSFSDVFIYRYIFGGILIPFFVIVAKYIQTVAFRYYFSCSIKPDNLAPTTGMRMSSVDDIETKSIATENIESLAVLEPSFSISQFIFEWVSKTLPMIVRLVDVNYEYPIETPSIIKNPLLEAVSAGLQNQVSNQSDQVELQFTEMVNTKILDLNRLFANKLLRKKLFDKERFTVNFIVDMAVFMTFGVIFPPVGFVIFLNVVVGSLLKQLWIGRFIYISKKMESPLISPLVEFLNEECKDVGQLLFESIPTIAILATVFWSFGLFDILGDQVGFLNALWILLLLALLPIWFYLMKVLLRYGQSYFKTSGRTVSTVKENDHQGDRNDTIRQLRLASTDVVVNMHGIFDDFRPSDNIEPQESIVSCIQSHVPLSDVGHADVRSDDGADNDHIEQLHLSESRGSAISYDDRETGIELRPSSTFSVEMQRRSTITRNTLIADDNI